MQFKPGAFLPGVPVQPVAIHYRLRRGQVMLDTTLYTALYTKLYTTLYIKLYTTLYTKLYTTLYTMLYSK